MNITIAAVISPKLNEWLDKKATEQDRKKSHIIRRLLKKAMDNEKEPESIELEQN